MLACLLKQKHREAKQPATFTQAHGATAAQQWHPRHASSTTDCYQHTLPACLVCAHDQQGLPQPGRLQQAAAICTAPQRMPVAACCSSNDTIVQAASCPKHHTHRTLQAHSRTQPATPHAAGTRSAMAHPHTAQPEQSAPHKLWCCVSTFPVLRRTGAAPCHRLHACKQGN
jgi:hypothetical protein